MHCANELPVVIGKSLQQVKGVGQYENGEAASRRPIQQEFQDLLMRERLIVGRSV